MGCNATEAARLGRAARRHAGAMILLWGITGCGGSSSGEKPVTVGAAPAPNAPVSPATAPAPPPPPAVGIQWDYSHSEDEMTSKAWHSASVLSENTVEFGFPYEGAQHGQLTIRRHPRHGNNVIFRIEKGQLLCPSYEGCTVLVRFDDGEPLSFSANPPADHSTETIFVSNYERFVSKMRAAKRVRISPKIYQQGGVVFTFDVSGFDVKKFRGE